MIEKQALPSAMESHNELNELPSLKSARFNVVEGELLRFCVDVIDSVDSIHSRGALYSIRFFNQKQELINLPYVGTLSSKMYGRFIYIRTYHDKEPRGRQLSGVVVTPTNAAIVEVAVYPFKASKRIRLLGGIKCFALLNYNAVEYDWILQEGQHKQQADNVFPFWASLFSFQLVKNQSRSEDICLKVVFFGQSNQVVNIGTSVCTSIKGTVEISDNAVFIQPVPAEVSETDKQAQNLLEALVQIVPPKSAVKVNVHVINQAQSGPLVVSYKLYTFANLIESRFDVEIFNSADDGCYLSYEVADITFSELLSKRARNIGVLDVALDFYKRLGTIERTVSTANHILNVITNRELYSKARLALSEVRASAPSWFPSPGKVELTESAEDKQLTVAHFMSTPDLDRICQKQDAEHVRAIAIMPLGYPKKGESGEPWERSEEEGVDCFFLNCVSAEQLELVPVTSQLNFMAVLAKDILRQEHVDLIHIHEDEASINSLLVGVALAKAFKIPLVYQKHTVVDEVVTEFDETKHSLAQAKLAREYQCMQIADAVIVQSETQRDALIKAGVQQQKISILPLTEDVAKGYTDVYELAQQTHLNKN